MYRQVPRTQTKHLLASLKYEYSSLALEQNRPFLPMSGNS